MSYPDYVEQLTYLLFLKMADERDDKWIPEGLRWSSFAELAPADMHEQYSRVLRDIGHHSAVLQAIFANSSNKIRDPEKLYALVVDLIGPLQWNGLSVDVKGDAYEGLLEKNARDTKSGAGQYFTPRAVVDAIVRCINPSLGDSICDPACGTGGFLLAAQRYLMETNADVEEVNEICAKTLTGVELVSEVARLATMNLFLHGIVDGSSSDLPIQCADSLQSKPSANFDVVVTNPPFGVKGSVILGSSDRKGRVGGTASHRPDFWTATSNKQLNFIQHVASILAPGGRAAVVVPDNVLYEKGAASDIRKRLVTDFDLHTILRLPAGLFYAHTLMANVLFFDRRAPSDDGAVWVYDLRGENRFSVKTRPVTIMDLEEFIHLYASTPRRLNVALENDRWWAFRRTDISANDGFMLDLQRSVSKEVPSEFNRTSLDQLSRSIIEDLRTAIGHMSKLDES